MAIPALVLGMGAQMWLAATGRWTPTAGLTALVFAILGWPAIAMKAALHDPAWAATPHARLELPAGARGASVTKTARAVGRRWSTNSRP